MNVGYELFTRSELDRIVALGDRLIELGQTDERKGKVQGRRYCTVAWIERSAMTAWIYEKLQELVPHWRFVEPLQYTVYIPGGFFDWHVDARNGTIAPRHLSLSLQLSHEHEYGGGELVLDCGDVNVIAPKQRGSCITFPSHVPHMASAVTGGVRKALIAWATMDRNGQ